MRLDEDILKTFSVYVFRRRIQDILIKTNIFVLAIRPQDVFKTSSRRFEGVFKTFSKHYQEVIKTSSRRLQDVFKTLSRRRQNVFKTSYKNVFKMCSVHLKTSCKDTFNTFSRRMINLNRLPSSRICLGYTSEKFMVSVENLQV